MMLAMEPPGIYSRYIQKFVSTYSLPRYLTILGWFSLLSISISTYRSWIASAYTGFDWSNLKRLIANSIPVVVLMAVITSPILPRPITFPAFHFMIVPYGPLSRGSSSSV
jgi:hypothetical protein